MLPQAQADRVRGLDYHLETSKVIIALALECATLSLLKKKEQGSPQHFLHTWREGI
jgi:hypothetical protein